MRFIQRQVSIIKKRSSPPNLVFAERCSLQQISVPDRPSSKRRAPVSKSSRRLSPRTIVSENTSAPHQCPDIPRSTRYASLIRLEAAGLFTQSRRLILEIVVDAVFGENVVVAVYSPHAGDRPRPHLIETVKKQVSDTPILFARPARAWKFFARSSPSVGMNMPLNAVAFRVEEAA